MLSDKQRQLHLITRSSSPTGPNEQRANEIGQLAKASVELTHSKGQIMLIVFSGLPGTGKTTIAKGLVDTIGALYLRIDTIEQAIRNSGALAQDVGRSGYMVANELALSNLDLGRTVIVDCVNPVIESRLAWSEIASRAGVRLMNIEVICSDKNEHQRRVETRLGDISGLTPPT